MNYANIVKTYSGKSGCMCGCNGKWSYNAENDNYGEVNPRSVKIIANKVLKNPAAVLDDDCIYFMSHKLNKNQVIYFNSVEAAREAFEGR